MRKSKYSAVVLRPLVASSSSLSDVIRSLGLTPNGGNHRMIAARIRLAGLDISHFSPSAHRDRVERVPRDTLEAIVRKSISVAAVLTELGLPPDGRCHREMSRRIRELSLDTSHFQGVGWARGFTKQTHPSLEDGARKRRFTNEQVFVENGPLITGPRLVDRLLAMGWPYRCSCCGIVDWCGKRLVLHVDHINGINNDHRLSNLRLLCPNCHSQTETYCNKAREPSACYRWSTRAWRNWLTHHI